MHSVEFCNAQAQGSKINVKFFGYGGFTNFRLGVLIVKELLGEIQARFTVLKIAL